MAGSARRQRSNNEIKVSMSVNLMQWYNDIIPIAKQQSKRPFRPMTPNDNTGLCPFHDDNDPSLHEWRGKQTFHCFGCHFTGDVVIAHKRFLQQYMSMNVNYDEVVRILASQYNITLDEETGFEVESPFVRARRLMFSDSALKLDKGSFTLLEYRQNNAKVGRSSFNDNVKTQNYAHLDLVASIHMTMLKEG